MGIDADGGAGDEGTQVFPFHNVQRLHLIRFHGENLIHPVGQHLVQHMQVELIPDFQLVQIGKQLRFRHAPVAGQGAVGAFAAQRIAGLGQMSDAMGQNIRAGALVNWQIQVDLGNGDVA